MRSGAWQRYRAGGPKGNRPGRAERVNRIELLRRQAHQQHEQDRGEQHYRQGVEEGKDSISHEGIGQLGGLGTSAARAHARDTHRFADRPRTIRHGG